MTTRRGFLGAILAAGVAPAAVGSGILMPVKKIIAPQLINVYDYKPEINFENWLELCPAHPDDKLVFAEFIFYLPPLIATELRGLGVPVKAEGTPLLRGEIGELSVLPATPARRQVAGNFEEGTEAMATKKMTEKQDAKYDRKAGIKENSARDMRADKRMGVMDAPRKGPAKSPSKKKGD